MTILTMTLIITTSLIMTVINTQYGWHYLHDITYSLSVKSYDKCDFACMLLLCMYVFTLHVCFYIACMFFTCPENHTKWQHFGQLLLKF